MMAQTAIPTIPWPFAAAVLVVVVVVCLVVAKRAGGRRDLRIYLEPPLRDRGAEFLSAAAPKGWFVSGPFPKFEFRAGPASRIGPLRGEYSYWRVVRIRDRDGIERELWAVVEFEVFKFARVRWRAFEPAALPHEIRSMLEK
jgi:hypothetical protein